MPLQVSSCENRMCHRAGRLLSGCMCPLLAADTCLQSACMHSSQQCNGMQEDQLVAKQDYNLPGYAFVHDIVVTPDYYILFRNPIELRQLEMLQGDIPPTGAIKFNAEEPLELQLIPRPRCTCEKAATLLVARIMNT